MAKAAAIACSLLGLGATAFVTAIALPFDDRIEFRQGNRIDYQPTWLVPQKAEFLGVQRGYGGLKILAAIAGTAAMGGAMVISRSQLAQEPLRQKRRQHQQQMQEHLSAAEAAYQMALAQQRYRTLLQADQVSFEGQVEATYLRSIGVNPVAALPGSTLDQTTDPSDKVSGQKAPAIASDTTSVPPSTGASTSSPISSLTNYPSVLVYGAQGSGKSTFTETEIQCRLRAGHRVVVLDPHAKFGGWRGCEVVGAGMDYTAIDAKLGWFADEVRRRYQAIAKQANPKFSPLTLVAEEMTNWASRCENAAEFLKTALSDIRKAEMFALIVSHTRTLPALGDAKGMGALRDSALLEVEMLGQIDPSTGRAVPRFEALIKLPGQGQGDRTLIKILRSQPLVDPRKLDPDYFERAYRLEFDLSQQPDSEPDEPPAEPLNPAASEKSSNSERRFTPLNLTRGQAIALIKSLKNELNLTQTIERIWQVTKGGTEGWKKAREEYRELMEE